MIFEGGRDLDLLPLTGAVTTSRQRRLKALRPAVGLLISCALGVLLWVLAGGLIWLLLVIAGVE